MVRESEKVVQSEVLSGWKDIANYLGKGVRTVQRYKRELGLPVRRPASKTTGSVLAVKSELDAWVASSRLARHSQFPVASLLSVGVSLKNRMAELTEIANQTEKLIVQIRAFRAMLRNPDRQIRKVKTGTQ